MELLPPRNGNAVHSARIVSDGKVGFRERCVALSGSDVFGGGEGPWLDSALGEHYSPLGLHHRQRPGLSPLVGLTIGFQFEFSSNKSQKT